MERVGWKHLLGYGALLAVGAVGLQWLDYQRLARLNTGDVYLVLVAAAFLALGIWVGARAFAAPPPAAFDGNPRAQAALGKIRASGSSRRQRTKYCDVP